MGGGCWRQTIFHPFRAASRLGRGTALQAVVRTPLRDTPRREAVPDVNAAAVRHDDGSVALFILNKASSVTEVEIGLAGFGGFAGISGETLDGSDLSAFNDEAAPDRVRPRALPESALSLEGDHAAIALPPLSWTVIQLRRQAS